MKILEWLGQQDPMVSALYAAALVYMIGKGIIKIPGVKAFMAKKTPSDKNPHTECHNYMNLSERIKQACDRSERIYQIRLWETLADQMAIAEAAALDLRNRFKTEYLRALKEARGGSKDGLINDREFRHYEKIVKALEAEALQLLKKWFKENHFTEKSDPDFLAYVSEKAAAVFEFSREFLDLHYLSDNFQLSREALFDLNMGKIYPEFTKIFQEMFFRVREISEMKKAEVQELNKEIDEIFPKVGEKGE